VAKSFLRLLLLMLLMVGVLPAVLLAVEFVAADSAAMQEYKHAFHVPEDMTCVLNVVSTAPGANTLTLEGYLATGEHQDGPQADLSGGKAAKIQPLDAFGATPVIVVARTSAPSAASLTCKKQTATATVDSGDGIVWESPIVASFTLPSTGFPTAKFFATRDAAANVFAPGEAWKNDVTMYNPGESAEVATTTPTVGVKPLEYDTLNPKVTQPVTRTIPLSQGTTATVNLDGIVAPPDERTLDTDITMTLTTTTFERQGPKIPGVGGLPDPTPAVPIISKVTIVRGSVASTSIDTIAAGAQEPTGYTAVESDAGVHATQYTSNGKMVLASQQAKELADVKAVFPHVFVPASDQADDWQVALSVTNTGSRAAIVIFQPYDADGKAMDTVVAQVPINTTLAKTASDLFKDVHDAQRVAWVEARSTDPIIGESIFKYHDFITSVRAAARVDLGLKLIDASTRVANGEMTSYAVTNPGDREETVKAQAYLADGTAASTATFKLAPRTKLAASINDIFGSVNPETAYVTFEATTPVPTTATRSPYESVGRITALSVTGADSAVTSAPLMNVDAVREQHFSDQYNPAQDKDIPKFNGGAHLWTATVISDENVDGLSYNPRGDGKLDQGYSAEVKNATPSRLLHGSVTTKGMPRWTGYIPETDYPTDLTATMLPTAIATGEEVDTSFNPTLILAQNGRKTTWNEPLTIVKEKNSALNNPDAYNAIRADPEGVARIFWEHRDAITSNHKATTLYNWIQMFKNMTSDNPAYQQYKIQRFTIGDESSNRFEYILVNDPAGYYNSITFDNSPSAETLVDRLKSFIGKGIKAVPKPGTYQK